MREELGKAAKELGILARNSLRSVPAVRKLYYSVFNAESFGNIFWHDVMLADRVRMTNYAHAIKKHIKPGMVVVDLGTGSGVLACLAAQRGATVHAIEHTEMIERAKVLASHNGITNITFHRTHSKEFSLPEKVDVILHEQIGMNLIDEDMVENILDLRDRVLKPSGKILPGHFELFFDPVELKTESRLPYLHEQKFEGLDFACFRDNAQLPWAAGEGYDKRALEPADVKKVLKKGCSVMTLDLHTLPNPTLPKEWTLTTKLDAAGRLDGFALYFKIEFDKQIAFQTGPNDTRTHWTPRLFRTEAQKVKSGAKITLHVDAANPTNAATWTWEHQVR